MARSSNGELSLSSRSRFNDQLLNKYHDDTVSIQPAEMAENERLALTFVTTFISFVREMMGLTVSFVGQGSAFERINVRSADEFDFLLVCLRTKSEGDPHDTAIIRREMADIKVSDCGLKCYQPIVLSDEHRKQHLFYSLTEETWPSTEIRCLSARRTIARFKQYLQAFDMAWAEGWCSIPEISAIHLPEVHNPALTTQLEKMDGTRISIDMSMSVCLLVKNKFAYYIAKTKPILKGIRDERLGLLWQSSYSQEEMILISQKSEQQLRNYRIVKSIFSVKMNSYIWKTLFMSPDINLSDRPFIFLKQMLAAFEGAVYAELSKRRMNPFGRHKGSLLLTRFNECENILARYDDDRVRRFHVWIQETNNRVELGLPVADLAMKL